MKNFTENYSICKNFSDLFSFVLSSFFDISEVEKLANYCIFVKLEVGKVCIERQLKYRPLAVIFYKYLSLILTIMKSSGSFNP